METRAEGNVWSRVQILISKRTIQGICPYFQGCNYVEKQIEAKELAHESRSSYYQRVCRNYPRACEKNLDSRLFEITELSGEEVHELLK